MKRSTKTNERRQSPRITVDFPATLMLGRKQHKCRAREFSEFGVLLAPARKELVGEEVRIEMALDGESGPTPLEGVVVYATDKGVAVRFRNTSREQQAAFRNYIRSQAVKP